YFFQWNVPPATPSWIATVAIRDDDEAEDGGKRGFLVNDRDSLVYIANLGCIPIHVLAYRVPEDAEQTESGDRVAVPTSCDFLTVDFDISKGGTFESAIVLARSLHDRLEEIGLVGFPKTSGQSGLHVLVPLGKGGNSPAAQALCELLGRILVASHPKIATME